MWGWQSQTYSTTSIVSFGLFIGKKTKTKWNKHPSPTYAVVYVWIKFSRKSTKIIRIFWKISICFNRFKRWGRLGRWVMKY
jgi:hypothetical protein